MSQFDDKRIIHDRVTALPYPRFCTPICHKDERGRIDDEIRSLSQEISLCEARHEARCWSDVANHSDCLRLREEHMPRLEQLYEEACRGQHSHTMKQREELKSAPEAPSVDTQNAIKMEARQCKIPLVTMPNWARHCARLRDHMSKRALCRRGPEGHGYDGHVYYFFFSHCSRVLPLLYFWRWRLFGVRSAGALGDVQRLISLCITRGSHTCSQSMCLATRSPSRRMTVC